VRVVVDAYIYRPANAATCDPCPVAPCACVLVNLAMLVYGHVCVLWVCGVPSLLKCLRAYKLSRNTLHPLGNE
jgi:hypothetical protein